MNTYSFIKGFQDFSLCDWPGRNVAVIFTGGCNLRCPTCHNMALVEAHHSPGPDFEKIRRYLLDQKDWLDGVTLSGGEPTIACGLVSLAREIVALGYEVNLHTNGHRPSVVRELLALDLVKLVSVDVKGPFRKYPALTGQCFTSEESKTALTSIFNLAREYPGRFLFRTTLVPGLTPEDLKTCRGYLPEGHQLVEQEYREPKAEAKAA